MITIQNKHFSDMIDEANALPLGTEYVIIVSNGSKWAGESPDSIETLLYALRTYEMEPIFLEYSQFTRPFYSKFCKVKQKQVDDLDRPFFKDERTVHTFGNFVGVSHVYSIHTNSESLINQLKAAAAERTA